MGSHILKSHKEKEEEEKQNVPKPFYFTNIHFYSLVTLLYHVPKPSFLIFGEKQLKV
jgi:hypothetical protein